MARKDFISRMLAEQNRRDLQAIKQYCIDDGYVEDYFNIFLPLYKKYGWKFIRDIGEIEWEWLRTDEYRVIYLNLDRLSTLVDYDENKQKWVAYQKGGHNGNY